MKRILTQVAGVLLLGSLSFSVNGQLIQKLNSNQTTNPTTEWVPLQKRSWNQFKEVPQLNFAAPNVEALLQEDEQRDKNGFYYRFGVGTEVNITPENSGQWITKENGDRVWQLKIHQAGALAQSFVFSKFYLYGNTTIDVYNKDGARIHRTYTKDDVLEGGEQNLSLCEGDIAMIELVEPKGVKTSELVMNMVMYAYRSYGALSYTEKINNSDPCQVNVNCSEGNNWQDEKRGVARIVMIQGWSQGLCTGSLINNAAQDCKPYFLTAMHCGEGTTNFSNWRFYFNYEAPGCANPTNSSQVPDTYISGAEKIAGSEDVSGNSITKSDFLLLQIGGESASAEAATINQLKQWNAYWNGWDANNTAAPSGVGIHHPSGDIKKISTFTQALTSTNYSPPGNNTHWRVYWSATANGHGVTEGGSSGSPIFTYNNGNSRIVGKLSGGTSYCTQTYGYDLYGKLSYSWTSAGNTSATQLKPWLDPNNTGVMVMDGSYDPCENGGGNPDPDPDPDPNTNNGACESDAGDCDEYIANVTLNTINNDSGCDGYIDYPNQSTTLVPGQQYQVQVMPAILGSGAGSYYTGDAIGVWIDWNGDGQFTGANETIGTVAISSAYSGGFTFTVPQNVSPGTKIMRVKIDYDSNGQGAIQPCGAFNAPYYSGEVEDYRIVIGNGGGDPDPGNENEYDLQVTLGSPASNAGVGPTAAQNVSFSITNNGPSDVAAGETMWLSFVHYNAQTQEETIYSLSTGEVNSVNGLQLGQGFPVGQTITSGQLEQVFGGPVQINTANYENNDRVYVWCLGIGEDPNSLSQGDPNDTNNGNNEDYFRIVKNVGLSELNINEIMMYPNPTSGEVNLEMNQVYEELAIEVYDLMGQLVLSAVDKNTSAINFNVHELATGVYQVAVHTEAGTVMKKLVKN